MRKSITVFIALALLASGGVAWALDTNTLTVSASVVGTCKFTVPKTSTLDFGALDPSVVGPVNGTTSTTFWCTKGVTTDTITADLGANPSGSTRRMKDTGAGTDLIPYSLTLAPLAGTNAGPDVPRTLNINGTVAYDDFKSVSAGNYADTVILTINN